MERDQPRIYDLGPESWDKERDWAERARLLSCMCSIGRSLNSPFESGEPCFFARAPGRLDVMGGIADYSGSLVLEMPLERSTWAVAQPQATGLVEILSLRDRMAYRAALRVADLQTGPLSTTAALREHFVARPDDQWASYIMGVAQACLARHEGPAHGVRLLVVSDVPEGKGISSSAALEVACCYALAAAWGVAFTELEVAHACQRAENEVAGAPCGIMDQVTSVSGKPDHLLRLLCQPATIERHVEIPDAWRFFGIDSGVRHAVSGSDYGTVRTAAFMGYRIIAERLGCDAVVRDGRAIVDDRRLGGYLANMSPDEFERDHAAFIPEWLEGAVFLRQWGGITDSVTRVDPARTYPVRRATAHPIHEHARVRRFAELLEARPVTEGAAMEMGRMMRASHDSYGACGLGSEGTDRIVQLVEEEGIAGGLYGARITGGGSGGTVAILARADAGLAVSRVALRYRDDLTFPDRVFSGSASGAAGAGVVRLDFAAFP